MTTTAHTSGPWYVDSCDDDLVFSSSGLPIATVGDEEQEQSAEENNRKRPFDRRRA